LPDIVTPYVADDAKHVYHIYAIRVQKCNDLMSALTEKEIQFGIHYPVPIHLQDAYAFLGLGKGDFPVAENCVKGLLSLPMFPELAKEQIEYVVNEIKRFVA
jgi:dTDP-4-amino-4,6-dideoxygalactose transaminase